MKRKNLLLFVTVILLSFLLTGCDYVNTAVVNIRNNGEGKLGRSSVWWSGVSENEIIIEDNGSKDITFAVNMKKGKLTLELKDSEGEEVYSLSREGKCSETIVFTADDSGRYTLMEKGKKFSGSYQITWGDNEETGDQTTGNGEDTASKETASALVINPEEISEEQLIEIISPDDEVLCQIIEKNDIIEYFQKENYAEWEEVKEVPAQADLQYMIMAYAKVTDEFWLEKGAPEITVEEEQLYKDGGEFYMKSVSPDDTISYHIPASGGEYIQKLAQANSNILNKRDVFTSWGINDFDISSAEETDKETDSDMSDEIGAEEEDNREDNSVYSAEELARVSKEQKIEIDFQDPEAVYTLTDLEEIANFYNQIKPGTWTEVERLPEEKNKICVITTFQLERHTVSKNLVENERLTLFEIQNQYYILDVIPGNGSDTADMEIYYSIPKDVAGYIEAIRQ